MKTRICPKCTEINTSRNQHCAACGTTLTDVPEHLAPPDLWQSLISTLRNRLYGGFTPIDKWAFRDQMVVGAKCVVFGLAFMLGGVILHLMVRSPYDRLMREGQEVAGVVIECTTRAKTVKTSHGGSYTTTAHYLFFRFEAPVNGALTLFEGREEVKAEDCLFGREPEQLLALFADKQYDLVMGAGQPVQVIYATSDPSVFALKDKLKAPSPIFLLSFCIFGGAFLLLGLMVFVDAFNVKVWTRG